MNILRIFLGKNGRRDTSTSGSPASPRYVPLETEMDLPGNQDDIALTGPAPLSFQSRAHSSVRFVPSSRRFWADFTLGFADGLTVPFALTAGLSSLGQTDTVLSAGLAEISAGCISMGIGGYLSAKQTNSQSAASLADTESTSFASSPPASPAYEKQTTAAVEKYLQPLCLPFELQQLVLDYAAKQPLLADSLSVEEDRNTEQVMWPVSVGLSVAGGYLVGGMLPLGPYFFVTNVGDGLRWSFAVCIVALFSFGFVRELRLFSETDTRARTWPRPPIPWWNIGKSTAEGLQMVTLGGVAVIAAVLCVRLFEDTQR